MSPKRFELTSQPNRFQLGIVTMIENIQTELLGTVVTMIAGLLMTLLSWAVGEAISWIRTNRRAGYLRDASTRMVQVSEIVVGRGMQTTVKRLKAAAEDGKLTDEEKHTLLNEALRDVLDYVGEQSINDLETVIDPATVRKMAQDAIEAAVARWKAQLGGRS